MARQIFNRDSCDCVESTESMERTQGLDGIGIFSANADELIWELKVSEKLLGAHG